MWPRGLWVHKCHTGTAFSAAPVPCRSKCRAGTEQSWWAASAGYCCMLLSFSAKAANAEKSGLYSRLEGLNAAPNVSVAWNLVVLECRPKHRQSGYIFKQKRELLHCCSHLFLILDAWL